MLETLPQLVTPKHRDLMRQTPWDSNLNKKLSGEARRDRFTSPLTFNAAGIILKPSAEASEKPYNK